VGNPRQPSYKLKITESLARYNVAWSGAEIVLAFALVRASAMDWPACNQGRAFHGPMAAQPAARFADI
jgi:hypothetical protein